MKDVIIIIDWTHYKYIETMLGLSLTLAQHVVVD